MKTLKINDSLQLIDEPEGLTLFYLASFEEGILDAFKVGIKSSNLQLLLKDLEKIGRWRMYDNSLNAYFLGKNLNLEFTLQIPPFKSSTLSLNPVETGLFLDTLRDKIKQQLTFKPVGRNDSCPCGSGKKYKSCCMNLILDKDHLKQNILPREIKQLKSSIHPELSSLIQSAEDNPQVLNNNNFWYKLGLELGQNDFHSEALICFTKAVELNSKDYHSLSNIAVTQSNLGNYEDALNVVNRVPTGIARKEIITANILQELNRHDEAIYFYEQGISFEPDFYLPYIKLLYSLLIEGRASYEFWLYKTITKFPKSTYGAYQYVNYLLNHNRYEELADADWLKKIQDTDSIYIINGRHTNFLDVKFGIFFSKKVCESIFSDDPDIVSTLVAEYVRNKQILISGETNNCQLAKILAIKSAQLGLNDSLELIYQHVCDVCKTKVPCTPFSFDGLKLMLHKSKEEFDICISECERILESDPKNEFVLSQYWWSLDEVNRTSQAISVAERLYRLNSSEEDLPYNLGYLCGKIGEHGKSKYYYQAQISTDPGHLLAHENLAFTYLIEQEIEKAQEKWQDYLDSITIFEPLLGSPEKQIINIKKKQFPELVKFAIDNKASKTYAYDLIQYNNKNDFIIGAKSSIKPKYDITEIWDLVCSEDTAQKEEGIFLKKMESRKDYSNIYSSIKVEVPRFNDLPEEARNSLIEAERRINDKSSPDFAPCVLTYAKAVEISLRELVFEKFRKYSKSHAFNVEYHIHILIPDKYKQAQNFINYIEKGKPLELGSMAFALQISTGKTAKEIKLLELFNNYVSENLKIPILFDDKIISKLQALSNNYRNPAAHSKSFNQEEAFKARKISYEMINLLP